MDAAQILARHVARLRAEQVAAVLRFDLDHPNQLLSGRTLIPVRWLRRLRNEHAGVDAA